jgi:ribosomal protein S18 acetylase RimI-like enzyme
MNSRSSSSRPSDSLAFREVAAADVPALIDLRTRTHENTWVIAVLPEYERRGIGNRLMGLAEEWLLARGCARAWLTTDVDTQLRAYGFYRRRGWADWKIEDGLRWMELRAPSSP